MLGLMVDFLGWSVGLVGGWVGEWVAWLDGALVSELVG